MEDIKSLCERVLIDADHGYAGKVTLADAERLAKAVIVLSGALERMVSAEYPTEDAFSAEQALTKANEIASGE